MSVDAEILAIWTGSGGEGTKAWMSVLTDLRNRGIKDVFFVGLRRLKGVFPPADPHLTTAGRAAVWGQVERDQARTGSGPQQHPVSVAAAGAGGS
jgi:hypothetical protein